MTCDKMMILRNVLLCGFCLVVQTEKCAYLYHSSTQHVLCIQPSIGRISRFEIELPLFADLKKHYPGFHNSGGLYHRHDVMRLLQIQDNPDLLLHDTSALRMSYTLNRIGYQHSLGSEPIKLSKYGTDSIQGIHGDQYIFHPLAFGPYLADKYGYPNVSKLHLFDPVKTKESFKNKQGIMRVITYTQRDNEPKGHVALWDCNGFFKARDFMSGHTLLSVEFWESPDSECGHIDDSSRKKPQPVILPVENSLKSNSDMVLTQNPSKKQTDTLLGTALMTGRRRHPVHRNRS